MYPVHSNNNKLETDYVDSKNLFKNTSGWFSGVTQRVVAWVNSLCGFEERRSISQSRWLREELENLERIPVGFSVGEHAAVQAEDYASFIAAAKMTLERLEKYSSSKAARERLDLNRALISLLYRLEGRNGGLDAAPVSQPLFDALVQASSDWKSLHPVFHDSHLSLFEVNKLQESCHYPEFVKLLLVDQELFHAFLNWALRDRIAIETFVQFPSISQKIKEVGLNGRIGRMGGMLLKVKKIPHEHDPAGETQKIVTLPFEGKETSLLDENKFVGFRGNYFLTIREIFEIFRNKKYTPGNLEFMQDGIINWNCFQGGWWDAEAKVFRTVDLTEPDWWKQLPAFETLSLREARRKYGRHLDGRQWNIAAVSTRERRTLDFEDAHSYMSIAIPEGGGRYAVYPLGKYASKFPSSTLDALFSVGETLDGVVAYPDENVYYTHRQRTRFSYALTEEQGRAILESVRRDMLLSREGNLIYQIESENCAKWVQKKIEDAVGFHRVPNLFQMPFLNSEPHGLMENVFAFLHALPKRWQIGVTTLFHLPLRAYKGRWIWENGQRVWKALTHHSFWQDTIIFHPSMLHKQQEIGLLPRFVREGVNFSGNIVMRTYHELQHLLDRVLVAIEEKIVRAFQKLLQRAIFSQKLLDHRLMERILFVQNSRELQNVSSVN